MTLGKEKKVVIIPITDSHYVGDQEAAFGSQREGAPADGHVEQGVRQAADRTPRSRTRKAALKVRNPPDGAVLHRGADRVAQMTIPRDTD